MKLQLYKGKKVRSKIPMKRRNDSRRFIDTQDAFLTSGKSKAFRSAFTKALS